MRESWSSIVNTSNSEINTNSLYENFRGILLADTSGLISGEFVNVLATSGTTGAEGGSIANSLKLCH